jgi:hypothetical protein
MTAVEWLQDCLNIHFTFEQQMQFEGLFQQAKEMEKQQGYSDEDMKNAFTQGFNARYKMQDGTESREKFIEQLKKK